MTPADARAILEALTPAQRNGLAFWTSVVTALIEASEPVGPKEPA